MSSQRGNTAKSGPQKHQNTRAYRNDLHRKDKTIKILKSMQITGCCKRCKEVIEWKIKYNKYKPLTRAKKCVKCQQKTVTNSYYIICQNCVESQNLCGKCALVPPMELPAEKSDSVGSEINPKSSLTLTKIKPEEEESDSDEDDSDLDDEVEKALTINDKDENKVSVKTNLAAKKDGMTNKGVDKQKVTFAGSEGKCDGKEEEVSSVSEDEEDKTTVLCRDNLNEGKEKSHQGIDGLNESTEKLAKDKSKLNEDEGKNDGSKLSTEVKKDEDDQSDLDDDDDEDDDDNGEDDDGDDEEEDGEED